MSGTVLPGGQQESTGMSRLSGVSPPSHGEHMRLASKPLPISRPLCCASEPHGGRVGPSIALSVTLTSWLPAALPSMW